MLQRMPKLVVASGGPMDRAVRKASTIVARRARQLAPSSKLTGSRKLQSKTTKTKWETNIDGTAKNPLREQIKTKLVKYPTASHGIIGPSSPKGNQAHFGQTKSRRHVLWGKSSLVTGYRIARDWIVQAFDETKSLQNTAMIASLRQDIDKTVGR